MFPLVVKVQSNEMGNSKMRGNDEKVPFGLSVCLSSRQVQIDLDAFFCRILYTLTLSAVEPINSSRKRSLWLICVDRPV